MKRNKILNLAYGSNLNLGQMAYRCPTAKVYGKGMLLDYQLLFYIIKAPDKFLVGILQHCLRIYMIQAG
jgi:hypothetical protein